MFWKWEFCRWKRQPKLHHQFYWYLKCAATRTSIVTIRIIFELLNTELSIVCSSTFHYLLSRMVDVNPKMTDHSAFAYCLLDFFLLFSRSIVVSFYIYQSIRMKKKLLIDYNCHDSHNSCPSNLYFCLIHWYFCGCLFTREDVLANEFSKLLKSLEVLTSFNSMLQLR